MNDNSNQLPEMLYKFRPFSLRAVADLAANRLFLSSPSRFNDAYDCRIPWNEFLGPGELEKLATSSNSFAGELQELQCKRPELFESGWRLNEDGYLHLRTVLTQRFGRLNECGVCSLSAVPNDLKMWAHYANARRGFCLGFSTGFAPFKNATAVRYAERMDELDAYKVLAGKLDADEAFSLLVTKSDIWKEEREFRIFDDEVDKYVTYDDEALLTMTFGDRASVEHMIISHSVLPEHVKFFVASPTGNRHELESLPVNRTVLQRYRE